MNVLIVIVGICLFLVLVAIVFRSSRWKTIQTSSGDHSEDLMEKHAFLHNEGFRCRLRVEENQPVSGISNNGFSQGMNKNTITKLQVHEDEVKKAADALERFERDRVISSSPIL